MKTNRRVLVINGHPNPTDHHFGHALAVAYTNGARRGGHDYRRLDLAGLDIPFLRSKAEWENNPLPPDLARAADLLAWADHIVLIFPLWLGTMPALVKAFLEHILRPMAGSPSGPDLLPTERLWGKSARIIVTMGMPSWWYRIAFKAHGIRGLERSVFRFCGARPVNSTLIGSVESNARARERALARVEKLALNGR